jgi:hypothetical protein
MTALALSARVSPSGRAVRVSKVPFAVEVERQRARFRVGQDAGRQSGAKRSSARAARGAWSS